MPSSYAGRRPLRAWQAGALAAYTAASPRDFLISATPGAGKTAVGLRVAADLLAAREIARVVVITPTDHLRTQWADAASVQGLSLDPAASNAVGPLATDVHGAVVTYAQVAAHPALHRARIENRRTLVVLDEVHHAGEARSWGAAIVEACEPARRRLSLSGTPFRSSPDERIPFINYEPDGDGALRSAPDYRYGYREALRDGVVRPVMFAAFAGIARWRTSAGEVVAASLRGGASAAETAAAWRTALDPRGEWIAAVLGAADTRLTEIREHGMPDAAGMVLAGDQDSARAYAGLLAGLTGVPPVVVLSDDRGASARIEEFRGGTERWLVAVRMVSEGVDIPRLAVGVYATPSSTPLFFAQAVGRFVRARRRGETATVFLPSVPVLLAMAAELERERDHVLVAAAPDPGLLDELPAEPPERTGAGRIEPLHAEASFDHVLFAGAAHSGTGPAGELPEELADFLGLPGLLSPAQTAALLRTRDGEMRRTAKDARRQPEDGVGEAPAIPPYLASATLRREVNALVARVARETGRSHAEVHVEVRTACGGPPSPRATVAQLTQRRDYLLRRR